jgi:peptidyl-prolyl cis-trans isomerase SurA
MKSTSVFLFLIFICINSFAQSGEVILDKVIAKVDNQILLKSEYDVMYLQSLQSNNKLDTKSTPCKVLEELLTNKLLLAKAEIDSVYVEDKQVDVALEQRMSYFITQIGSKEKLEAYYNKSVNQLKSELRKQVKEQLIVQKMQSTITDKIKITPGEVKKFFSEIPADSLPLFSKEYEISHIVKYASVNRDQKSATKEKLTKIRNMIVNEEDRFEKLAKEFSEDPVSARNGGELGYFKKGELVPEYEAAALKLKPGETSPVTESMFGFHIIQLLDRKGNEYNTRHILLKAVSSESDIENAAVELDSLRSKIIRDSLKFEIMAKEHSDDKATKESGGLLHSQSTPNSTKIPAEEIDPVLYFSIDSMKVGSITKPIRFKTEDGQEAYRIVFLKSATLPHQANLKDDYQKIMTAALQEKKNKAINRWFNKSKSEVYIQLDPEYKDCEILKGM